MLRIPLPTDPEVDLHPDSSKQIPSAEEVALIEAAREVEDARPAHDGVVHVEEGRRMWILGDGQRSFDRGGRGGRLARHAGADAQVDRLHRTPWSHLVSVCPPRSVVRCDKIAGWLRE